MIECSYVTAEEPSPQLLSLMTKAELMAACSSEAHRLATVLKALDRALAEGLDDGEPPGKVLQSMDLVCQEADGLAAVLQYLVADRSEDALVDQEGLMSMVKLRAQRERLQAALRPDPLVGALVP